MHQLTSHFPQTRGNVRGVNKLFDFISPGAFGTPSRSISQIHDRIHLVTAKKQKTMQFCLQGDNPLAPRPTHGAVDRFTCSHRSARCRFDVVSSLVARRESLTRIVCKRPRQPYSVSK